MADNRKSMLDHLRDGYDALAEALRPKPGPTLTVEPVRERGMEEPRPKDRFLDKHQPAEAEKIRQAEPMAEGQERQRSPQGREEKPTDLKHEYTLQPKGPTIGGVGGLPHTNTPTRQQPQANRERPGLVSPQNAADARSEKPMASERLVAKLENRPEDDLLKLAQARLAATQEIDKTVARSRSRSMVDERNSRMPR